MQNDNVIEKKNLPRIKLISKRTIEMVEIARINPNNPNQVIINNKELTKYEKEDQIMSPRGTRQTRRNVKRKMEEEELEELEEEEEEFEEEDDDFEDELPKKKTNEKQSSTMKGRKKRVVEQRKTIKEPLAPDYNLIFPQQISENALSIQKELKKHVTRMIRLDRNKFYLNPVREDEVEDYYEIIKKPMCFNMIKRKVEMGCYETIESFKEDVRLICDNAIEFNGSESIYSQEALNIEKDLLNYLSNPKSVKSDNFETPTEKTASGRKKRGSTNKKNYLEENDEDQFSPQNNQFFTPLSKSNTLYESNTIDSFSSSSASQKKNTRRTKKQTENKSSLEDTVLEEFKSLGVNLFNPTRRLDASNLYPVHSTIPHNYNVIHNNNSLKNNSSFHLPQQNQQGKKMKVERSYVGAFYPHFLNPVEEETLSEKIEHCFNLFNPQIEQINPNNKKTKSSSSSKANTNTPSNQYLSHFSEVPVYQPQLIYENLESSNAQSNQFPLLIDQQNQANLVHQNFYCYHPFIPSNQVPPSLSDQNSGKQEGVVDQFYLNNQQNSVISEKTQKMISPFASSLFDPITRDSPKLNILNENQIEQALSFIENKKKQISSINTSPSFSSNLISESGNNEEKFLEELLLFEKGEMKDEHDTPQKFFEEDYSLLFGSNQGNENSLLNRSGSNLELGLSMSLNFNEISQNIFIPSTSSTLPSSSVVDPNFNDQISNQNQQSLNTQEISSTSTPSSVNSSNTSAQTSFVPSASNISSSSSIASSTSTNSSSLSSKNIDSILKNNFLNLHSLQVHQMARSKIMPREQEKKLSNLTSFSFFFYYFLTLFQKKK